MTYDLTSAPIAVGLQSAAVQADRPITVTSHGLVYVRAAAQKWDNDKGCYVGPVLWGTWSAQESLSAAAKLAQEHSARHGFDLKPNGLPWSWGWWNKRMEERLPALDADALCRPVMVGTDLRVQIARKPVYNVTAWDVPAAKLVLNGAAAARHGKPQPGRVKEKGNPWEMTLHQAPKKQKK